MRGPDPEFEAFLGLEEVHAWLGTIPGKRHVALTVGRCSNIGEATFQGLEEKYEQLKKGGVRLTEGIKNEPFGRTVRLRDPDGHDIYLWQPPSRSSTKFGNVSGIVEHYEKVLSRLEQ